MNVSLVKLPKFDYNKRKKNNKLSNLKYYIIIVMLLITNIFSLFFIYKRFKLTNTNNNNSNINNNPQILLTKKSNSSYEHLEQQFNLSKEFIKLYSFLFNSLTSNSNNFLSAESTMSIFLIMKKKKEWEYAALIKMKIYMLKNLLNIIKNQE